MPIVYQATNKLNGERYVGKTNGTLDQRRRSHENAAKRKEGFVFHRALIKYGIVNWHWETLSTHETEREAFDAEIKWIASLKPRYNLTQGGEGASGAVRSAETRAHQAAKARGRKLSPETIQKIKATRLANGGYKVSDATRQKMAIGLTGRTVSAETREKISAANRGRKLLPDQIAKMAASNRGKKQSRETIEKRSAQLRGRVFTVEHRQKIALAKTGGHHTDATKAKLSAARKGKPMPALRGQKRSPEVREKLRRSGLARRDEWLARSHLGPAAVARRVVCVDDGTVYPSASAAARACGVAKSLVIELCKGDPRRRTAAGRHFVYETPTEAEARAYHVRAQRPARRTLSADTVREIRGLLIHNSAIAVARQFGLDKSTVFDIKARRVWKEIADAVAA